MTTEEKRYEVTFDYYKTLFPRGPNVSSNEYNKATVEGYQKIKDKVDADRATGMQVIYENAKERAERLAMESAVKQAAAGAKPSSSSGGGSNFELKELFDDEFSWDPTVAQNGDETDKALLALAMGMASSNRAVNTQMVLEDIRDYVKGKGKNSTKVTTLLGFGLAAVGTIKEDFAIKLNAGLPGLGPIGESFRGKNGPNFRGFTTLGNMLMIGIIKCLENSKPLPQSMVTALTNYKRFVPSGDIRSMQWMTVTPDMSDKDEVRVNIMKQTAQMFQQHPGGKEHLDGACELLAQRLAAGNDGVIPTNATNMKVIGTYVVGAEESDKKKKKAKGKKLTKKPSDEDE